MMNFDFAILGDSQPEGLLVAAGLVRKGFSVVIVPSASLGEMPPDAHWPLVLPSQLGQRKLNDLLFRAGFFRLEESGLSATTHPFQTLLPKHRLLFDGSQSQWLQEIEREFPHALKTFSTLFQNSKKISNQQIQRAATEIMDIQKRDPHFRAWIESEVLSSLRPAAPEGFVELLKLWLHFILRQETKAYRVDSKMKTPYHHFLSEHARKWGAVVCGEDCEIRGSWGSFQISKNIRAAQLVLNGMGGGRLLAKTFVPKLAEKMRYWMYLDSIDCPLSSIPEPLQEFALLNNEETVGDAPSYRHIHLTVDRVRGEAHLSIGSWLSFEDTKTWVPQIEKGRAALRRLMPFLPGEVFRNLPTLLELTEMRGECIRRGQADRLIPEPPDVSNLQKVFRHLSRGLVKKSRPRSLGRRIFAVTPHYLPYRNRLSSFEASLNFLDHFEKKKRKQLNAS